MFFIDIDILSFKLFNLPVLWVFTLQMGNQMCIPFKVTLIMEGSLSFFLP